MDEAVALALQLLALLAHALGALPVAQRVAHGVAIAGRVRRKLDLHQGEASVAFFSAMDENRQSSGNSSSLTRPSASSV